MQESDKLETYIVIPDSLINNPKITILDLKVYGKIKRLKNGCSASHSTLASWCGCERRSLLRSISRLKKFGWLERDKQGFLIPTVGKVTSDPAVTPLVTERSQTSDPAVTLTSDPAVTHTRYIYTNIDTNNNIDYNKEYIYPISDKPVATRTPKKTIFDKSKSITREIYQIILADPKLANGDREYLKDVVLQMEDWSQGKGEKRIDWAAALRNWIRRNRQNNYLPNGVRAKNQPKCFAEIEKDYARNEIQEFLNDVKSKEIKHADIK